MKVAIGKFYLVRPYVSSPSTVIIKAIGEIKGRNEGQRVDSGSRVFFKNSDVIRQLTWDEVKKRVPFNVFA